MTDASTEEIESAPPAWEAQRDAGDWAVVEIMGHRVVAGSISSVAHLGVPMLQVQHPSLPDHADVGPLTEIFAATAIFSIRPCSRADATRWAESRWRRPAEPGPSYELVAGGYDDEWDYEEGAGEPTYEAEAGL